MGRVCEGILEHQPLRPNPPAKGLADIVGHNIARFEPPQEEPVVVCTGPNEDDPLKTGQCMGPRAAAKVCDDLLAGIVPDYTLISDDRCKVTDPFHQKNKRLCGVRASDAVEAAVCCDRRGTKPCADMYCTSDALYDAAASNYFKYREPMQRRTECKYPFPCKAHCFAPPPRRNPLYDSVAPQGAGQATRGVAAPLQFDFTMVKPTAPSADRNNQGPTINYFVGVGWEESWSKEKKRNGI